MNYTALTFYRRCFFARAVLMAYSLLTTSSCALLDTRPKLCTGCQALALPVAGFPPLQAFVKPNTSHVRHVYLEGDGNPWVLGNQMAINPNTQHYLGLQLMHQDTSDTLYLQRPCYGYQARPPAPCSPTWWTNARYSAAVVSALNQALTQVQNQLGAKPLVLIGHSGGGTLALLMAEQRTDVAGIITLAGNLDPAAWVQHHQYLPLSESLNPATRPPLTAAIFRWHLLGNQDTNIPNSISQAALAHDPLAQQHTYPAAHQRGWLKLWPHVLEQLKNGTTLAP